MRTVTVRENGVSVEFEVHSFGSGAPRVFFTAGVHGNEVTGIYVARKLIEYLEEHPLLRGTVDVIPTVNAAAMRCMQRRCPFDGEDLNRIFPGNDEKSISHKLAAAVWRETADADALVDIHCCGQHSLPYILSVYSESEKALALVFSLTLPVCVHSDGTGGQLFIKAVREREQAACIIELPSGAGSGAVNLPVAEQCFMALLDLLRAEGMLPGEVQGSAPSFYGTLQDASCPKAGLWLPLVAKGDAIREGQPLGTLDGAPVTAPASGMVMSARPAGYIRPDDLDVVVYVQPKA